MTCKFGTGGAHRLACRGDKRRKGTKKLARALHVHSALQPIKSYGAKYTMPRSTHRPSLVYLAKNFLAPEDPTSKKSSDPGACSLHPTGTTSTKAHTLELYTCDLQIWGSVVPPVWPAELARSLCKPSRGGTCHVPRASCTPEKVQNHASAGWVYPP